MAIDTRVEQECEYLISLRRWFHQHPEISMKEYETAHKIEQELDLYGIEHRRVGETGVYATIHGKNAGRKVVLRADIDALSITDTKTVPYASRNAGVMHACGHDAHTASLLGAAKLLKEHAEEFDGEIGLIFQQGEEYGQGAKLFIKEGILEDVDRVFGIHVASNVEVGKIAISNGPVNASVDHFTIKIEGKNAHVSTPQLGLDALYVATQVVNGLQGIVSRLTDPLDTVIVGIGRMSAGTAYNIVAANAEIEGTTRCFTEQSRKKTNQHIIDIVEGIAKAYGAKATVEFEDFASCLVNDKDACDEVIKVAEKIVGKEQIVPREKSLGGDDFSEFLRITTGMYAYIGTGNPAKPDTVVPQHACNYDIDEEAILIATNLYISYALEVMHKSE